MIGKAIDMRCLEINADKGFLLKDLQIIFQRTAEDGQELASCIVGSYTQMYNKTMFLEWIGRELKFLADLSEFVLMDLRIEISQRTDDGEWSYSEDTAVIEWQPSVSSEDFTVFESNYRCEDGDEVEEF